jgi:hypothetical protein
MSGLKGVLASTDQARSPSKSVYIDWIWIHCMQSVQNGTSNAKPLYAEKDSEYWKKQTKNLNRGQLDGSYISDKNMMNEIFQWLMVAPHVIPVFSSPGEFRVLELFRCGLPGKTPAMAGSVVIWNQSGGLTTRMNPILGMIPPVSCKNAPTSKVQRFRDSCHHSPEMSRREGAT